MTLRIFLMNTDELVKLSKETNDQRVWRAVARAVDRDESVLQTAITTIEALLNSVLYANDYTDSVRFI